MKTYIVDDGVLRFPIKGNGPFEVFDQVCGFSGGTLKFDAEILPSGCINFNTPNRCYQVYEHNQSVKSAGEKSCSKLGIACENCADKPACLIRRSSL